MRKFREYVEQRDLQELAGAQNPVAAQTNANNITGGTKMGVQSTLQNMAKLPGTTGNPQMAQKLKAAQAVARQGVAGSAAQAVDMANAGNKLATY